MKRFEYQVCTVQDNKVTWVNGDWNGLTPIQNNDPKRAIDSCPDVYNYLNKAGAEGWELTAIIDRVTQNISVQFLYLKREL